jgi:hypothetical protein
MWRGHGAGNKSRGLSGETTSQWASQDFYAGDVHDPMSQHPFMYDDNNPVQYADPSGYAPCSDAASCVMTNGGQKGQGRKKKDKRGGEKGDARRQY